MPKIVEIQAVDDPRDVIHEAVQRLAEGQLVCLPTETVYVVAADASKPEAADKIKALCANRDDLACTLAVQDAAAALDYVPNMSRLGRRLSRRCWPGPVTLLFDSVGNEGLAQSLPEEVFNQVMIEGTLRLCSPGNEVVQSVLRLMPSPLILVEPKSADNPPATAEQAAATYGDEPVMLVDDGPSRYGALPTEVRITGDSWKMERESVVNNWTMRRLASRVLLFVCTGNTCRSPMAEGMFRNLLAERLKCSEDDLAERGYIVASAGIAASMGGPPSPESVEIMRAKGINLNAHASQPLTGELLAAADHVYTMTTGHRDSILHQVPTAEDRVDVLSREGSDISDPIGCGIEEYQACADEIEQNLKAILAGMFEEK